MVVKRMLNCDFDFSTFPKAPRSSRRKVSSSSQRDGVVDCGMSAIDILASVAEKLLEERESSSTSTNAFQGFNGQDHLVGKMKQGHVYTNNPCKSDFSHQPANLGSSKPPSDDNTSDVSLANDCIFKQTPVSGCKRARGVKALPGWCGNKKKEGCHFHVESGEEETCVVNNVEGGLIIADTSSFKDPNQLPVQQPLVHLDGHVQLSPGTDGVANGYRNRSKLVCRDDDENHRKYYKKCNKSYRPPLTWAGHRRVNKSVVTKYGRAVPRSTKCFEDTKTDGCVKAPHSKRNSCYGFNPWKDETVHRKRRLSDKGLVLHSDGGLTSESDTNPPVKEESENGALSAAIGVHSEESRVKFSIKSLRIPELFIEVPETATVGSLKRTVMEAVTALLDDGISIGVLAQGKKVRDDNSTLSQTGLSRRENLGNLGFTLEPGPEKLPVPPLRSENPIMSKPTESTKLSERSAASLAENCVENNQELLPYQIDVSADEQQPSSDSRALVPVSALEPEALAIVPFEEKPKRTENSQRRTRRPFSVTEVEALVHSVEELGAGRWRDVKLRSFGNASHRTYVDLKDKWKTLVHTASISPQQRRGEPVPQELLDRVSAAHRHWSQHSLKQNGKHQAALTMAIEPSGPSM
ncbi:hypothetical protein Bca4012_012151 [Brassica carinata]|uniref:Uncharacterized protein n=1 Tax=Brassica carinata TaxID=52824 RepID=A0A8X7UGR5_BRACI|nr:hypothetical protein Bca52824_061720 [Brassica carinata]